MAEHYTRGTESVTAWCAKCRRMTEHRVDHPPEGLPGAGRLGPCVDPAHPAPRAPKPKKGPSPQGDLFQ